MPLVFSESDEPRIRGDGVCWYGWGPSLLISCIATADALIALSGFARELTNEDRLRVFNKHRKLFQRVATAKYDAAEVNEAGPLVIVSAADVAKW